MDKLLTKAKEYLKEHILIPALISICTLLTTYYFFLEDGLVKWAIGTPDRVQLLLRVLLGCLGSSLILGCSIFFLRRKHRQDIESLTPKYEFDKIIGAYKEKSTGVFCCPNCYPIISPMKETPRGWECLRIAECGIPIIHPDHESKPKIDPKKRARGYSVQ